MGTLTFLFESLYAIQNNLLQQQKLLVNCQSSGYLFSVDSLFQDGFELGACGKHGPATAACQVDWLNGPLVPDWLRLHSNRGQTKPFASKYSIFFGPGPSLSCFSILPRSKTNTREPHFNMTYFYPDLHIPWVRLCPGNRSSCTINLIFWLIEG